MQHIKDEIEFHKRHPEMIVVWIAYLTLFIYCIATA